MSYDVRIGVETTVKNSYGDNHTVVYYPELDSPTYNLGPMFRACMDWDFSQSTWYPLKDVIPRIERGIDELANKREKYEKYNPSNGWGSIESALKCLRSWHKEIVEDEYSEVKDWPLEALYWRW